MKNFNINYGIIFFSIMIFASVFFYFGCYQYPDIDETAYENYRRVIGPNGGTIEFYRNYENDSLNNLAVKMIFPENSVDSYIVFNMYEYNSEILEVDLNNMNRIAISDFLYFVPFYESEGYNEHSSDDIDEHNSLYFNDSVEVTYYLNGFNIIQGAKLYRINIPSKDEWGNGEDYNIWVNYNLQGYPEGYDEQDLMYLINGLWTEEYFWGTGPLSFDNWEEIVGNHYNISDNLVSFYINETDYIYVMAADITK